MFNILDLERRTLRTGSMTKMWGVTNQNGDMTWAAKTLGTESSQKTWRNGGFSCARVKWMMWRWIYWYYISRDPRKKGMVKSEHVNDCKCGSELTPKGTLEEVWLSLTGQYIHIYICIYIYMPYFEVQLPGNDMLPVALPKTTQTNYLQVCLPEFQTPVRVVKVISTPILGFAGKMFCLYHLRGLSSFLDFLWIISAVGKLPEISPQTPGIMFLSPSVDGGVAGGLCDVVQLVVGFLKVGDVDLVPLQHVLGQVVRLSSLLFVLNFASE